MCYFYNASQIVFVIPSETKESPKVRYAAHV